MSDEQHTPRTWHDVYIETQEFQALQKKYATTRRRSTCGYAANALTRAKAGAAPIRCDGRIAVYV